MQNFRGLKHHHRVECLGGMFWVYKLGPFGNLSTVSVRPYLAAIIEWQAPINLYFSMDFSLWRPLGMRYGQFKKTKMSDFMRFIDWFLNFWNRFIIDQNLKINRFWAVLGLFGPFFAHKMANNGPILKFFNFFEVLDIPAQNGSNNFFSNCRVPSHVYKRLILLANRFKMQAHCGFVPWILSTGFRVHLHVPWNTPHSLTDCRRYVFRIAEITIPAQS